MLPITHLITRMNTLAKKLRTLTLVFTMSLLVINSVVPALAQYWVSNPSLCPFLDGVVYPGVNCYPNNICGDNAGTPQCSATSGITAPVGASASSTRYSTAHTGGYILNCYATMDSGAPYCDNNGNAWCNADTSCLGINRLTTCTATTWYAFTCGPCVTGYNYCDGSYTDADGCEIQTNVTPYPGEANAVYNATCNPACATGYNDCDADLGTAGNGCEIQDGSSCGLNGTYSGCTCNENTMYFETGVNAQYSTVNPLLQGTQYGSGPLAQLGTNTTPNLFSILNDGSVFLAQITAPVVTTDLLYNVGGNLFWNGSPIVSGSTVDLDGDTKIQVEESPDEDYIRFDTAGTEAANISPTQDFTLNTGDLFLTLGDIFFGTVGLHDTGTDSLTSGASQVGVYNGTLTNSTGTNMQDVLEDFDSAITNGVDKIKQDVIKAEFPGAIIYGDGTNNIIDLFLDPATIEGMNCYDTTTSQTSPIQDVNISYQWGVPYDYQGGLSIDFYYKTDSANVADNYVQLESMYDTAGNPMTYTPASTTQYANTSWIKQTITITGTPTITPGGNLTLVWKLGQLYNTGSERAALGDLIITYTGKD